MLRAAKHICLHNGAEEGEDVKIFFQKKRENEMDEKTMKPNRMEDKKNGRDLTNGRTMLQILFRVNERVFLII